MRGLCGWFSRRPADDGLGTLDRMFASGRATQAGRQSTATQRMALGAYGQDTRPVIVERNGWVIAAAGHPRWRGHASNGDALTNLALALSRDGKSALGSLGGDFAIVAWDTLRHCGLLAIDRIGAHQLVYTRTPDGLAFGTTLDAVGGHPQVRRSLAPQGIFDYLHYHVCPGPDTILQDHHRVPPGHVIEFCADGTVSVTPHWSLRFEEVEAPFAQLKDEFVALLEAAVKEASDTTAVGAFLSGGTDSSTVCGMLARVRPQPASTFSIGFDVPGFDETGYARIAAKHFKLDHHEYYVTPVDVVSSVGTIAASYDQPFGNASAVPAYHCAKFAREHGIRRLLAGDGGDELFGGNERYAKQHLLSLYGRVPGVLRRGLQPLLMSTPGIGKVPPLRKLRSYVEQASPAMPFRYETYNLLDHLGAANVLTADFLASVDPSHPRALLVDSHAPFVDASLINQMLAIDIRFVLADGDLPKVGNMCNLAGVDVTYPLLDDRLVDFSERLSSDMKLRGTRLRWFFKRALDDFLPREIITKQKHGFGLPVGQWLVTHEPLFDLAKASIDQLQSRGIVRPQFVDQLMHGDLHRHAGYFGTMAWVLMMLGLWLDSRKL